MAITINGSTGVTYSDNIKHKYGTGEDLEIYHDGSDSYIKDSGTGLLKLESNQLQIKNDAADEKMIVADANGAVELYYNGVKKFETNQYGNKSYQHLYMDDSHKLQLGSDQDLQIYHTGSNAFQINGTGNTLYQSAEHAFYNADASELLAAFRANGDCELRHDNSKKLHTYSEGCKVTGYIKAANNESDSHWPNDSYNWHKIANNDTGQGILILEHSGDSDPYGIEMYFTDNTPDDTSHTFFYAADLTSARFRIYSDGDVWNHDNSYTGSDQTLKENIVDATPKLEDIKKLKVRNFNWKSEYFPEKSKQKQLGFIAQEVEEVFPSLVSEHDIATGEPDHKHTPVMKKAIKQAWDPIIIKAMQELIEKVETLETKVAALEAA